MAVTAAADLPQRTHKSNVTDLHAWASATTGANATDTYAAVRELSRLHETGTEADGQLIGGRAALQRLLTEERPDAGLKIRRVTDIDELRDRLLDLARCTQRELLSLHAGAAPPSAALESSISADQEMLARKVKLRIGYPSEFAAVDHMRDYVQSQSSLGARFRFADAIPYRMVISDATRAVVPLVADAQLMGAIITTEPVLVKGLHYLATAMLRSGRELSAISADAPSQGPTEIDRKVIQVMGLGLTDDAAA
ncbi:MAG: hypothetical protein ABI206_04285, partial [Antricoccus sp.]